MYIHIYICIYTYPHVYTHIIAPSARNTPQSSCITCIIEAFHKRCVMPPTINENLIQKPHSHENKIKKVIAIEDKTRSDETIINEMILKKTPHRG